MDGSWRSVPGRGSERSGDDLVFRCSACALASGAAVAATASFGCANEVLTVFAPQLSWLLLAPAGLIALVAAVGVCSSFRAASSAFRAQLGIFLFFLGLLLTAAGGYVWMSADATANWISAGCQQYRTEAEWSRAGRVEKQMRRANAGYEHLRDGWTRCRSLNPLVFDLHTCGIRARVDGREVRHAAWYGLFRHMQLTFDCGGFCIEDVPLFGPTTMRETLVKKSPCAIKAGESVQSLGHIFAGVGVLVSLAVAAVAFVLLCASSGVDAEGFDFEEVASDSDGALDDDGPLPQKGHYRLVPTGTE